MKNKAFKQSTINMILGGIITLLIVLLIGNALIIRDAYEKTLIAQENKTKIKEIIVDEISYNNYLITEIRKYVQTENEAYYDNYLQEIKRYEEKNNKKRLPELGMTQKEAI